MLTMVYMYVCTNASGSFANMTGNKPGQLNRQQTRPRSQPRVEDSGSSGHHQHLAGLFSPIRKLGDRAITGSYHHPLYTRRKSQTQHRTPSSHSVAAG